MDQNSLHRAFTAGLIHCQMCSEVYIGFRCFLWFHENISPSFYMRPISACSPSPHDTQGPAQGATGFVTSPPTTDPEGKPLICDTISPSSVTPKPPLIYPHLRHHFPSSATPSGFRGGMITSMFLCAHRHGNLITRELAVSLCPFSPWWSVLAAQQPKSSKTSLVCLAVLSPRSPFWRICASPEGEQGAQPT